MVAKLTMMHFNTLAENAADVDRPPTISVVSRVT